MALHIGHEDARSLSELQRTEINDAFANLEKCKQASTSKEGKQLQQVYFKICQDEISDLERIIEMRESEIERLKIIEENMRKKYNKVKALYERSIEEQTTGVSGNKRSRSSSSSKDKEEKYPKEERNLVEKVAHSLARVRHQQYMREKTENPNLTVSKRQFDKLPNQDSYYNPNLKKKGGRTMKNKK